MINSYLFFFSGIFTMNWTSGESGSHLYKIHSGQTFEERCMKVSCRVCQTIFDDVSAYERHICAIFFREKFNVDFKTLDDFLALKDDREATGNTYLSLPTVKLCNSGRRLIGSRII